MSSPSGPSAGTQLPLVVCPAHTRVVTARQTTVTSACAMVMTPCNISKAQPLGLEHAADSTELMDKAQLTHTGKTCGCLAGHVRGLATRLPAAAGTCRPCQDFCCCLPQGLRQVAAQATSGIAATCNRWQQVNPSIL